MSGGDRQPHVWSPVDRKCVCLFATIFCRTNNRLTKCNRAGVTRGDGQLCGAGDRGPSGRARAALHETIAWLKSLCLCVIAWKSCSCVLAAVGCLLNIQPSVCCLAAAPRSWRELGSRVLRTTWGGWRRVWTPTQLTTRYSSIPSSMVSPSRRLFQPGIRPSEKPCVDPTSSICSRRSIIRAWCTVFIFTFSCRCGSRRPSTEVWFCVR